MPKWNFKLMFKLLLGCLPMFLGVFMLNYIINQPKFVLDNVLDEVTQNKFGIIFMPSAVICLMGMFIYRPLLTTLTSVWKDKKYKMTKNGIKFVIFGKEKVKNCEII